MVDAAPASYFTTDLVNYFTGTMVKQGGRIKTWKRRFFVLDKANQMLRYYKNEDEALPKGVIDVAGYGVAEADAEIKKQFAAPTGFAIKIEKVGFRTYFMITDDDSSRQAWIQALRQSADIVKNADNPYSNYDNDNDLSDDEDGSKRTGTKHANADKPVPAIPVVQTRPRVNTDNDESTVVVPISHTSTYSSKLESTRSSALGGGFQREGYRDDNATLITDYVKPDPKATLIGADMLGERAGDPFATLVPSNVDNNATLVADGIAGFVNNSGKLQASGTPSIVPRIRLFLQNRDAPPIERDILKILKLGRAKEDDVADPCFIGFDSKVVSRRHAEIWAVNGEFYIRDTKSQSGTFLNAMRLSMPGDESKPFKLKNGDIIQLGVDYRGGTEENTKSIAMICQLSFVKQAARSDTDATAMQRQMTDLTLVAGNQGTNQATLFNNGRQGA